MQIDHVPLLQMARDLHDIPRGMERFKEYLRALLNETQDAPLNLPLVAMNPMGREHVVERLDELIALDGDAVAADAAHDAAAHFPHVERTFRHGLVLCDDLRGGWTNRYTTDAGARFALEPGQRYGWLSTILWVSEPASLNPIRQQVRATVARNAYTLDHGTPKTLRQMLVQEGVVSAFAGITPTLDADDIEYSRFVLAPHLDSDNWAICFAALYGDTAARSFGYPPLGLSDYAGFSVATADALGV